MVKWVQNQSRTKFSEAKTIRTRFDPPYLILISESSKVITECRTGTTPEHHLVYLLSKKQQRIEFLVAGVGDFKGDSGDLAWQEEGTLMMRLMFN